MTDPTDDQRDGNMIKAGLTEISTGEQDCPAPDIVAAYVDGGLTVSEVEAFEAHASRCARCQTQLATLVRSVEPATQAPSPSVGGWRVLLAPRWALPAAAVLAAAVWVATGSEDQRIPQVPVERRLEPPASRDQSVSRPAASGPAASAEPASSVAAEAGRREEDQTVAAPAAPALQARPRSDAPVPLESFRDAEGSAAAVAEPAVAPVEMQQSTDRLSSATREVTAAGAPAVLEGRARVARVEAAEIMSPDPAVRWRLEPGGLSGSTDGGRTWTRQVSGLVAPLVAGSAPSPTVCWAVGEAGQVLRTEDGRTWQVARFPLQSDLVSVEASDGRVATVTAADGQRRTTADGGRSWRRLP